MFKHARVDELPRWPCKGAAAGSPPRSLTENSTGTSTLGQGNNTSSVNLRIQKARRLKCSPILCVMGRAKLA